MRIKFQLSCTLLLLAGCGQSTDARFAKVCAETKEVGGRIWASSEKACTYAANAPAAQKEDMIRSWEKLKSVSEEVGIPVDELGELPEE